MAKPEIRNSVNWVKGFSIDGVDGSPDELHKNLYRMEQLIIEQLPFMDGKVNVEYGATLKNLRDKSVILHSVESEITLAQIELKQIGQQFNAINEKYKLLKEIEALYYRAEGGKIEGEDLFYEEEDLYEKAKYLFEDEYDSELDDVEHTQKAEYLLGILEHLKAIRNQKNDDSAAYNLMKDKRTQLLHKKFELQKDLAELRNNIRIMQENAFKGMEEQEFFAHKTTLKVSGKPEIVVDHSASSVAKEKAKFSENLVFASVTFIVEDLSGSQFEVSIPVKVPNEKVVNLSKFKPSEYMVAMSAGSYDSSNDYLTAKIKDRYARGKKVLESPLTHSEMQASFYNRSDSFSHSEQALFSALLESPEVRNDISYRLRMELEKRLEEGEKISNYKVNDIVLDLHTSRYMCDCCATSALGFQDNSKDKLSFKNLMLASLSKEMEEVEVDLGCEVHLRASASVDFQTPKKLKKDHSDKVELDSELLSQKDLRIDGAIDPYSFRNMTLLSSFNEHTLFTSGDTENPRFKTAYAMALRPLIERNAVKIQKAFKPILAKKLADKAAGIEA